MVQRIGLAHGEGGELTHQLIQDVFVKSFGHGVQTKLDSAILPGMIENMAVTTDSFVVNPIFFPGGNIGKLAITGTVNDLAVCGAIPRFITAGFILEEGFPVNDLKKIVQSMAEEAERAGVHIIAGDTKVVEKGSADGLFINTTGIGELREAPCPNPEEMKKRDAVIISGTLGDHGVSILSARNELGLMTDVTSDCASLNHLIQELTDEIRGIRIMRDPTRGGLATTLVEICEDFQVTIELEEDCIPIRKDVQGACDILGFDPLYLANEGKIVLIVDSSLADRALTILRQHVFGRDAEVIGQVSSLESGKLLLKTPFGTTRRLQRLSGMLLPRIC
ncbi:hydrogenase expression/formation protein HypE [Bacillus sp. ISL-35]|uniref:hydrogenase expression/formation protein HypE n=1 Tax=Bacillus sp. ISL-35 TaxID=2819122 RepID=UPI001BE54B87|nr:hydrogenase expression/formation protein HypE [Bacillus sp. ISL-35]MBT2681706.1 hydrogenase expression/formation protein HypE [Bacillus sp. ISL-35]MBT2706295.1 hydrogenase expression/formation protein HypE [Chryseobacterium sp. ISL-80]